MLRFGILIFHNNGKQVSKMVSFWSKTFWPTDSLSIDTPGLFDEMTFKQMLWPLLCRPNRLPKCLPARGTKPGPIFVCHTLSSLGKGSYLPWFFTWSQYIKQIVEDNNSAKWEFLLRRENFQNSIVMKILFWKWE